MDLIGSADAAHSPSDFLLKVFLGLNKLFKDLVIPFCLVKNVLFFNLCGMHTQKHI